jgi:hypothetical protein
MSILTPTITGEFLAGAESFRSGGLWGHCGGGLLRLLSTG